MMTDRQVSHMVDGCIMRVLTRVPNAHFKHRGPGHTESFHRVKVMAEAHRTIEECQQTFDNYRRFYDAI